MFNEMESEEALKWNEARLELQEASSAKVESCGEGASLRFLRKNPEKHVFSLSPINRDLPVFENMFKAKEYLRKLLTESDLLPLPARGWEVVTMASCSLGDKAKVAHAAFECLDTADEAEWKPERMRALAALAQDEGGRSLLQGARTKFNVWFNDPIARGAVYFGTGWSATSEMVFQDPLRLAQWMIEKGVGGSGKAWLHESGFIDLFNEEKSWAQSFLKLHKEDMARGEAHLLLSETKKGGEGRNRRI